MCTQQLLSGSIHFKPPDDDGRYYIGGSKSSWQISLSSLSYESSRATTPAKKKKEKRKVVTLGLLPIIIPTLKSKYDVCRNEERREGMEK